MILSHIVAMSRNRVIGKDNKIPWYLPSDLKYFRQTTLNLPILMGKNTYLSIGKPLPKRTNLIISKTLKDVPGCLVFSSINEAISHCKNYSEQEVFIIGGGEIYWQTIDLVSKIYLTKIEQDFDGDTFYPEIPESFKEISKKDMNESDLNFSFQIWEKK